MNTSAMLSEDQAWAAVLARDPAADAELVYAVTTTGIFCRPTCPSRRPERENVRFFPDPAAAADAGFRPCRRCRPQQRKNQNGRGDQQQTHNLLPPQPFPPRRFGQGYSSPGRIL